MALEDMLEKLFDALDRTSKKGKPLLLSEKFEKEYSFPNNEASIAEIERLANESEKIQRTTEEV